jgi:hypothetical protein
VHVIIWEHNPENKYAFWQGGGEVHRDIETLLNTNGLSLENGTQVYNVKRLKIQVFYTIHSRSAYQREPVGI